MPAADTSKTPASVRKSAKETQEGNNLRGTLGLNVTGISFRLVENPRF
ncbi:hypothetical protein F443_03657 [Phytophthora nicotianae P1569]|uniref:Uncharacterized protein n=1 Tax=Phytophthora nicotianae P1569 TaxID=1317065 RepID=V9FPI1_PHYNI|nr:hypothetical protein F443_03657 [Phytophthora nicotianae P1569]